MKLFFIFFIRIYKFFLSPLILSSCRFHPSCSHYFIFVLFKYNFLTAFFLILKRIFKCFFLNGGYDPSP
ncbi:MAG TPA: membrane protein insertion efficiency factor YidD [Candidatus Azoamicus sp.]